MEQKITVLPPNVSTDSGRAIAGTYSERYDGNREAGREATSSPILDRLLSMADVKLVTSLSRTTIYRMVEAGTFPKPIKIGASRIAWRASIIARWQRECAAAY